MFFDMTFSN